MSSPRTGGAEFEVVSGDLLEQVREASGEGERRKSSSPEQQRSPAAASASQLNNTHVATHSPRPTSPLTPSPEETNQGDQTEAARASSRASSHHTPEAPVPHEFSDPAHQIANEDIDPALLQADAFGEPDPDQASHQVNVTVQESAQEQWSGDRTARPGDSFPGQSTQQTWPLQTSLPFNVASQPPSSSSESPATPLGLGINAAYSSESSYNLSRQSSLSNLSYFGAEQGTSVGEGSEFGGESDAGGGVPGPKPKKSHARKQPPGHIKRARNKFILFRKHITDSGLIPPSVEVKHQNISVVAAKMWREAPLEVRQKFEEQALREKEEHQRKYPGYRYQPVVRRTDIIRRRVRKDPAEDDKVDAVAEALIKGKAGDALEKEIREQMTTRSEAGDSSDGEGSRQAASASGSRRRRREVGQLSKGAIRAQRAQARAKQMRQNLLGSNLLNMSMYNAAQQQQQAQQQQHARTMHAHTHPGMQYAVAESYLPVGYDLDGRPVMPHQYPGEMYPHGGMPGMPGPDESMYHLPPLDGPGYNLGWPGEQALDPYWNHPPVQDGYVHPEAGAGHPDEYYGNTEYALPPLMEGSHEGVVPGPSINMSITAAGDDVNGVDPRMRDWTGEENQTPSGHVMFSERLFDGLGSAGLGRDDGLAAFDEAMKDAQEINPW